MGGARGSPAEAKGALGLDGGRSGCRQICENEERAAAIPAEKLHGERVAWLLHAKIMWAHALEPLLLPGGGAMRAQIGELDGSSDELTRIDLRDRLNQFVLDSSRPTLIGLDEVSGLLAVCPVKRDVTTSCAEHTQFHMMTPSMKQALMKWFREQPDSVRMVMACNRCVSPPELAAEAAL